MLMSMSIIIKSIRLKRGNAYRMVRPLKVRLGTDCSGTDSPLYGVKQTQLYKKGLVSVSHEWSCDISTAAQEFIALNHRPKQFFADVRKRRHEELPHVDVYVNGLPCQQWSSLGKRLGWHDPRTAVYNELVKTLRQASIRSFILENEASLLRHDKGRTLKKIIARLAATGFSIDYRDEEGAGNMTWSHKYADGSCNFESRLIGSSCNRLARMFLSKWYLDVFF